MDRLSEEILHARGREDVLVMLTQPKTCVPCRRLRPHIDKLNEGGLSVLYVDLDRVPEAMVAYGIRSVPTVYLYPKDGDEERTFIELKGRTVVQLQKEIEAIRNA
jgi:thioredoxin-like negative regulator of GroEL